MLNNNFASFLFGPTRSRAFEQLRRNWRATEAIWARSPLADADLDEMATGLVADALRRTGRAPMQPILGALISTAAALLVLEDLGPLEVDWSILRDDALATINFEQMLARRRRWAGDFEGTLGAFASAFGAAIETLMTSLPDSCFAEPAADTAAFEVPLIDLVDQPGQAIEVQIFSCYDADCLNRDLFHRLRELIQRNLAIASGLPPGGDIQKDLKKLVLPTRQKDKPRAELADLYLRGTPFRALMDRAIPFSLPDAVRFEHCHILGGTGQGKTQLMQRMIHADLVGAQQDGRSIVVIDSQGDLINKLVRLDLFSPGTPRSLADRLVLIDPSDVEFPASLNLFDAHLERAQGYRAVDRERVLNGVIELYEIFFGGLLGAELTQKQGVIFKYLARLMMTIPGATIHTLMRLMEDGKPFRPYMERLEGSAAYFFATEFFHPSFVATKKQILRRLWGVLSTPAFERMFAQRRNKLDLFEAMNAGKIILINTAKDLLKEEGSQLFGRFFVALIAQAALERSTVPRDDRTPTFVYVDEAQEYFDERIETILTQARKYAIAFHCAHQSLDQPSPSVRSALLANTSLKCVGGVSAKDACVLASELRTTTEFIEGMRRRTDRTEFAVWLKHLTPSAIRLTVPLGFLERQPILSEEEYEALLDRNRARYCGTLDEVERLSPQVPATPADEPAASAPDRGVAEVSERQSPDRPDNRLARQADDHHADERPGLTPTTARQRATPTETGKGGSQHRYVQHLIKQLADERGYRTVIEAPVDGGQVDVALYRGEVSIACEISVTSTAKYEAQNLAKCLRAGFTRVWAISNNAKHRKSIEKAAQARLSAEEFANIEFLTTTDVILLLDGLMVPSTEETTNRGYKVTTNRKTLTPAEAVERRKMIERVLSQSTRTQEE